MPQKVKFKRKTTDEIDQLEIEDGSLIYNIENGKTYMDYGTERIPTGGGANGGIYVGDTEPTDEDITLWVDTNTSETKASEIVDEYTESNKVGYSCNYLNNNTPNAKILWTNPSPTSNFGAQTITLLSNDYDILEVFYYPLREIKAMTSIRLIKGENMYIPFTKFGGETSYGIAVGYRVGTYVSDMEYTFTAGLCHWTNLNRETRYTYNDCAIPLYVVGYKTGLFS